MSLVDQFKGLKILIVGDVMLDSYVWGKVDRISPEAPVPVVSVIKREMRLGGAANVALNLKALGAEPIICGSIGADVEGKEFLRIMHELGLNTEGLLINREDVTTVKHRIIGGSQQMIRVDSEITEPLSESKREELIKLSSDKLKGAHALLFQDYDKGLLDEVSIAEITEVCNKNGIPTSVDPKKKNFKSFKNVELFKPNLKELREGLNLQIDPSSEESIKEALEKLRTELNNRKALLTLSEHGVAITDYHEFQHVPAAKREIADVSGAGDTVISIATLALAIGMPLKQLAILANLGGGLVCEHVGVVPIDPVALDKEARKYGIV